MIRFLKSFLARLLPHEFRQNLKRRFFVTRDMHTRLANLRSAGFELTGGIDGGSFHGEWAREVWRVWPEAPMLLIEPQPACREILERVAKTVPGSKVAACALGVEAGAVEFGLDATNSSVVSAPRSCQNVVTVPMKTLNSLCAEWTGIKPNFLKLDLQGYELEALRGADQVLADVEVLLLEISVLRIGEVPIFREVDRRLEELGFRLYDVIPQYYRPLDNALWQVDAFYVRETSPLIASRAWS
jgi:FkbM family methyltransferase